MRLDESLLAWYDATHRHLPWRANPGKAPNPYHVLLSEIMLQQTTVATVIDYFHHFINRWPTLTDFAAATKDEVYHGWQGLGYYSRARNLHQCIQKIVAHHQGQVPQDLETLLLLPGIGPYTAAAISAIAYNGPVVPVDGNIIRVFSRLLHLETELPQLQQEIREVVKDYVPPARSGDFAQGLMDLGATICKPQKPLCQECPIQQHCRVAGLQIAGLLPRKKVKAARPVLHGITFWYEDNEGRIWLRRRPEKGLLANLMEFPGTPWRPEPYEAFIDVPLHLTTTQWTVLPKQIIHTFTHFQLRLTVVKATGEDQLGDIQVMPQDFKNYALPTLMKKVAAMVVEVSGSD
ncbi:A/G-specific adenine glycosylase [Candidatus Paracaedibacter symbiosus]|uniref:A/G-specific adenine glycosylase n=1 Tax=Candidatus Paracaedibacter symbiosus TaxID=244582 RepID=UPI000509A53E|nr:A/G-specific adenine glycosylase [Candidatus Paracaedibacter symbiosus]